MSLVKVSELRELTEDELRSRRERLDKECYELVQKRETGQLDRPHRFRQIRREIAQILTVMKEKGYGGPKRQPVNQQGGVKKA